MILIQTCTGEWVKEPIIKVNYVAEKWQTIEDIEKFALYELNRIGGEDLRILNVKRKYKSIFTTPEITILAQVAPLKY